MSSAMASATTTTATPSAPGEAERDALYREVLVRVRSLLEGEDDLVAAMATVVAELHHSFDYFHWTGFYRAIPDEAARMLVIGPYQGGHGCLRIPFERGVCGACARTGETQLVPDVELFPGHIACSATTRSEIVVPMRSREGRLLAVLDVDSNLEAAFSAADQRGLEAICAEVGQRFRQPA